MRTVLAVCALLLVSCVEKPQAPLAATDVEFIKPMPGMKMGAAYMSLANNTDRAITIVRISSPQFDSVELHETTIEDGVARMRAMPKLSMPAGATLVLQRGGKHLMLMRPTHPADTITLEFYSDEALILTVDAAARTGGRQ